MRLPFAFPRLAPAALLLAALGLATGVSAKPPRVVATIPPVHGLVSAVMAEAGEPALLIPGDASPHDLALRPSQARALAEAELVVMVGAGLEAGLAEAVATLAADARVLKLAELPDLDPLPLSEDEHGHAAADESAINPHLWLDPAVARRWLEAIAGLLAELDPDRAALYAAKAEQAAREIDAAEAEVRQRLAGLQERDYVVFHDAYPYFERRFGLGARGRLAPASGAAPGARRVAELGRLLAGLDRPCIFAEPQEGRALIETLARDSGARIGLLDPLGADLPPGPGFYPALLRALADGFADCLGGR